MPVSTTSKRLLSIALPRLKILPGLSPIPFLQLLRITRKKKERKKEEEENEEERK